MTALRPVDGPVTLTHGAGGKATRDLVEGLFLRELRNPLLAPLADAALVPAGGEVVALTTDAYVVRPLVFPGGDIGSLAVHGTVNDLAVMGARPLALAAAWIVEEGFPGDDLRALVHSMAAAAARAGVPVATGDTKVVERGHGDGVYVTTTGVGAVPAGLALSPERVRPGDAILLSGPIAEHGMAVMIARGELDIHASVASDSAPVHELTSALLAAAGDGLRVMRDPTRGGLATALNELSRGAALGMTLHEPSIAVQPQVEAACEVLGIDPLYVACEGRLIAIVAASAVDAALAALHAHPLGAHAAVIGRVTGERDGMVVMETAFGGARIVDMLAGDPLPRIC